MASAVVRLGGMAMLLAFLPAQSEGQSPVYVEGRCGGMPKTWPKQGIEYQPGKTQNKIELGRTALQWNGKTVDGRTLKSYFSMVYEMQPQPVTVAVIGSGADCTKVAILRRAMETQLQCTARKRCVEYSVDEWSARNGKK